MLWYWGGFRAATINWLPDAETRKPLGRLHAWSLYFFQSGMTSYILPRAEKCVSVWCDFVHNFRLIFRQGDFRSHDSYQTNNCNYDHIASKCDAKRKSVALCAAKQISDISSLLSAKIMMHNALCVVWCITSTMHHMSNIMRVTCERFCFQFSV